jgi:hypothetical protein
VLHWGADLGDSSARALAGLAAAAIPQPVADTIDGAVPVSVLPAQAVGWTGAPGLAGHRDGAGVLHRLHRPAVSLLGGGELLLSGEVRRAPGGAYRSPWLYGSYGRGLDELSARFHRYLRGRPGHPRSSRPVIINTWEAVYSRPANRPGGCACPAWIRTPPIRSSPAPGDEPQGPTRYALPGGPTASR